MCPLFGVLVSYHGNGVIGGWIQNITIRNNNSITRGGNLIAWGLLENSIIENNESPHASGVELDRGSAIIANSIIRNNITTQQGGGGIYIDDESAAIILGSTIDNNTILAEQNGAGIYTESPIMIRSSTISGNAGANAGGGIYSESVVDMSNSTISDNSAINGGGFYVLTGTLSLDYSTITNNQAAEQGGGIFNADATTINGSIIAGNSAGGAISNSTADCLAPSPLTFAGYSIFGEGTGCGKNGRFDQTISPATVFTNLLHPLADNDGSTNTHATKLGSLAINAGNDDHCPSTDQRGILRPQANRCDIGAFEKEVQFVYLPIITK